MLIIILLSVINIEGDYYLQIYNSSTIIDLYFMNEGFMNPTFGQGIIGADENPATLGFSSYVDFYAGLSLSGKSTYGTEEVFEIGGVEDLIEFPFKIQYNALGGFNYIGISKRLGPLAFGISYGGGYRWGAELGLNGRVTGTFHPEDPYEFTHSDYSEIPVGDTIRVKIPFEGGLSVETPTPIRAEYSTTPFFIGTGLDLGPLKLGTGLKFSQNRIFGEGSFSVIPDTFKILVDTSNVNGWVVDSLVGYAFINDTLVHGELSSTGLNATQTALNIGCILDAKIIKFSFAYEYGSNFGLSGGYRWLFSHISDLPETYEIDTSGLIVDTLIKYLGGRAGIIIGDIPKDIDTESDNNINLYFSNYHSLRAGLGVDLYPLKFGLSGSIDFPSAGDYSLSRWNAGVSLAIPFPIIDINAGFALSMIWLQGSEIEDENIFFPSATAGLSLGYSSGHLHVDLPVKMNISQFVLSNIEEIEEGEIKYNLWDNISFGLGLRVSL